MTPDELYQEFKGRTTLQCYDHAKKLIGTPVLVRGFVHGIDTSRIQLWNEAKGMYPISGLEISHEGNVSQQLVVFNHHDLIELHTVLTNANFGGDLPQFSLNTVAVTLISTPLQRHEATEAEVNKRHERTKGTKSIVGVLLGAVYGLLIGLAVAFVIQLKGCFTFNAEKEDAAQKASEKPMVYIIVIVAIIGGFVGYYNKGTSRDAES